MKSFISILLTGLICLNNYNLSAQNAPISTIGAVETYNDTAIVSITVTEFSNIGSCELVMNYDPAVATATSVTLASGIGYYYFIVSVDTPGLISVTWLFLQYNTPGVTLPDNSVFLNITFERANYGFSAIEFDNSLADNCLWGDSIYDELNDIPYSTYYIDGSLNFAMIDAPLTSVPDIEDCVGQESIDIPVTVSAFEEIGTFILTMQYDATVFSYQFFTNNSGFPNLAVYESSPGTIIAEGLSNNPDGFTLSNNSTLFTVNFTNQGGSTALTWLDIGESCEYKGPAPDYEPRNDNPQSSFYINGSFTELPVPSEAGTITGPSSGAVCAGENEVTFSVSPILYADSYVWTLPDGATITSGENTHEIVVSFSYNAISGDINVYGINNCGNGIVSPSFPLIVETVPETAGIITGPPGGTVCQGENEVTFSVSPILYADSYVWTLPDGATITNGENTNEITVSFSNNAISGDINVYGINNCGNGIVSPPFPLIIETAPIITVQPISPDTVNAGDGTATFTLSATGSNISYQWQEYTNTWADVSDDTVYSGALTSLLTITNPPLSMNGNKYRCIVGGSCEPAATSDGNAVLTVVLNTGFDNSVYEENHRNNKLKFEAFPNPSSDQITFGFVPLSKGRATIEISNMYGIKVAVLTDHIETNGKHLMQFNTRQLISGIYTATITFKNKNRIISNTLKIISKKK
jgi:hypothetical protein